MSLLNNVKRKIKAAFKFKPFSLKQKKVLSWWIPTSPVKDKDGIIADGAIRSGKTLSMAFSFVMWAMNTFSEQNFAMCGKTIGSFRRNVVPFLKLILWGRGYKVQDSRTENLLIISKGKKVNYFYIFGGKDERSQDLIQGITLAGVFFDEVALMPQSFVNQATGRCSVYGSKFWFNCNPDSPEHWFKKEWIDKAKEKRLVYLHFTMDDNLSLTERIKERYRSMYAGVFFNRFILGLWVVATGIVFGEYNPEVHKISRKQLEENIQKNLYKEFIGGVDWGYSNEMAAGVWGVTRNNNFHLIWEYYKKGQLTQDVSNWLQDKQRVLGKKFNYIFCDSAEPDRIQELINDNLNAYLAEKAISAGLNTVKSGFKNNEILICEDCVSTENELLTLRWAEEGEKGYGDDTKFIGKDHACDGILRYAIHSYKKDVIGL